MRAGFALRWFAVLCACSCTAMTSFAADAATQSNQNTVADIVFRNGNIHTIDSFHSRVQAVAIKDGKFLRVGSNDDIKAVTGKGTEVINLRGKMVMPGLIDTHIHAVRGALGQLYFCQFPVESSVEQIQAAVKKCAAGKKKGEWIEGKTWDSALSGKVTAADLDKAAPDNPVYLHDDTNHLGWLNTAALKAAKITNETPDPAGGAIDRDSSGNLDRIQIVKGFINKWGRTDEKIYDVALSDDRKADPKTGKIPPVGNTVDIKNAT